MAHRDEDERAGGAEERGGPPAWTKQELMDTSGLSSKSFDTLRKAARVKGPTHGGLGYVYGPEDLFALIQKAESGKFSERGGPAARAWRQLLAEARIAMPEVISRARR